MDEDEEENDDEVCFRFLIIITFVTLIGFLLRLYVCILYVCICMSKSLALLNKSCVYGDCSSYIDQEEQLREAARGGRVDEVASLLDQGVDIQCKDGVRNERID